MFDSIEFDRQTVRRAVAYLPAMILLFFGVVLVFAPSRFLSTIILAFPAGIEYLFGSTVARASFTRGSYAVLLAVLLFDAVANSRAKTLAAAGVVAFFNSAPRVLHQDGNDGKAIFVIALLLFLSAFIVSREK